MVEKERRELVVPVTVEFEDVDAYRIVHHSKHVLYLERARLRLIQALGVDLDGDFAVAPVVYELKVRFRKPAMLLDQLEVAVFVESYDAYRLKLGYRIRRDGETLVRATSDIAFADVRQGTLVPAPDHYVEALEAYLQP